MAAQVDETPTPRTRLLTTNSLRIDMMQLLWIVYQLCGGQRLPTVRHYAIEAELRQLGGHGVPILSAARIRRHRSNVNEAAKQAPQAAVVLTTRFRRLARRFARAPISFANCKCSEHVPCRWATIVTQHVDERMCLVARKWTQGNRAASSRPICRIKAVLRRNDWASRYRYVKAEFGAVVSAVGIHICLGGSVLTKAKLNF